MSLIKRLVGSLLAFTMVLTICPVQAWAVDQSEEMPTYTIAYDALGGSGAPAPQVKQQGVDLILSDEIPVWENRTFRGWHKRIVSENEKWLAYQQGETYTVDEDMVLEALWSPDWEPVISVGSISGKQGQVVEVPLYISNNLEAERIDGDIILSSSCDGLSLVSVAITDQQVENGQIGVIRYQIPNDAPAGEYTVNIAVERFELWVAGRDESSYNYRHKMPTAVQSGMITVLPEVQGEYTITYDANGGTGAPPSQTAEESTIALSDTIPTRINGKFLYWQDQYGRTCQPGDTVIGEDLILTAIWAVDPNLISPSLGAMLVIMENGQYAAPGEIVEIPVQTVWIDGMNSADLITEFGGWKDAGENSITKEDAPEFLGYAPAATIQHQEGECYCTIGTAQYRIPQNAVLKERFYVDFNDSIEKLSITDQYGELLVIRDMKCAYDGAEMHNYLFNVFANTVPTYQINYYAKNGENVPEEQFASQGETIQIGTQIPTREGYIFTGWSAWLNGEELEFDPGDEYTVNEDLHLTALWKNNGLFTVTYYANTHEDGICTDLPADQVSKDGSVTLSDVIPTRPNGKFMFWQELRSDKHYQPGEIVSSENDLELIAMWALDWDQSKGCFVQLGNASGKPGDTVEIPVYIRDENAIAEDISFYGDFISFERENGLNVVPVFEGFTSANTLIFDEESHRGVMIGTAKFHIPENIDPAGEYYAHLDSIMLGIQDKYGYLQVITGDKYAASGEEALAINGRIFISDAEQSVSVAINENNFPDANFRAFVDGFDANKNGVLEAEELEAVTEMDCNGRNISDLRGIECFTELTALWCYGNQLTSLDVSSNTKLMTLSCFENQLTALDVSNNTALTKLWCYENRLNELNISNNERLEYLYCGTNQLTLIDTSRTPALIELYCDNNQLISLDVSSNTKLVALSCLGNQLTALSTSANLALQKLWCYGNQITTLDVSGNENLTGLYCYNNQLKDLDISNNTELRWLYCYNNQLTSLDVGNNLKIESIYCKSNQLTSLDVSNNTKLSNFQCANNSYKIILDANRNYDLSLLPGGFDVTKVLSWVGDCTVRGNVLTLGAGVDTVYYTYDCGRGETMYVMLTSVDHAVTAAFIEYQENTYDGGLCSNMPVDQKGEIGESVVLSDKIPTRPSGKFMYWQDANTGEHYQPGQAVTLEDGMVLVAIWALEWDTNEVYLAMQSDLYAAPGSIVEVPIILRDTETGIKEVYLQADFKMYEVTDTNGTTTYFSTENPASCTYSYSSDNFVETEDGIQIGTVCVQIPENAELGKEYLVGPEKVSRLVVCDEYGPLIVYLNDKSCVDGKNRRGWYFYAYANTAPTYRITYITNEETTNDGLPCQYKTHGKDINLTEVIPTKEGYTFLGWTTDPDTAAVEYRPGEKYVGNKGMILYAVWKDNTAVSAPTLQIGKAVSVREKQVIIPISISNNTGVASMNFKIEYDKTRLLLTDYDDAQLTGWMVGIGSGEKAIWVDENGSSVNGDILFLKFMVLDAAEDGFAQITVTGTDIINANEEEVAVTVVSGGIEVISRVPGDTNDDGKVSAADVLRLKKYLAGMEVEINLLNADVTGNGKVSAADLLRLKKYFAGMDAMLE